MNNAAWGNYCIMKTSELLKLSDVSVMLIQETDGIIFPQQLCKNIVRFTGYWYKFCALHNMSIR